MFHPLYFFRSPELQTILPVIWPFNKSPCPVDYWLDVKLEDGDVLRCGINLPQDLSSAKGLIVSIHGLAGSSDSSYNRRLTQKLTGQGYIFCRMNLRGCGFGKGLAKKTYHAGQIDDLHQLLLHLIKEFPETPLFLLGFSLGANLMLRYLGATSKDVPQAVRSFVAVSPPFDLMASSEHLKKDHSFWDRYFSKQLISIVEELHQMFPELGSMSFPDDCDLVGFDSLYTAPKHGFGTVENYYKTCSSGAYLKKIGIPGAILGSLDDPIVSYDDIPPMPHQIKFHLSRYGGHCGFIARGLGKNFFWLDRFIQEWFGKDRT